MMNYAAAYGTLEGLVLTIMWNCQFSPRQIDKKEIAAALKDAIQKSKERGENYDRDHDEYGNRK